MSASPKSLLRRAIELAVAVTPWLASMYTLYWLEYGEIWSTDTPHRGKASVAILTVGMLATFLLHSFLVKCGRR
ncbi:MAG: hypothetical protein WBN09_01515 [Woeseiaceae bacterium]